jgi:hypothetical protein
MSKRVKDSRRDAFFNLKIYRKGTDAEFEVSNIPLKLLDDVVKNVKIKYR